MAWIAEQMRTYLRGWKTYFRLAQPPQIFKDLDSWIRHQLRAIQLKHWHTGNTVYSRLRSLGAGRTYGGRRGALAETQRSWVELYTHGRLL